MDYMPDKKKRKKNIHMSEEITLVFVDLVFRHEAIWNRKHKDYKDINRRNDDWCSIADQVGLPVNVLKDKWASLQSTYRKCRSTYNKSLVTGSGADEVDNPTWFAYSAMRFLDGTTDCGKTLNTVSKYIHSVRVG
ncbi:uncharacterized protein LOC121596319 [Anopheles merus]|nr:uncharacterized protein LOC121596319 [Anopheles merus]